MGRANDPPSLEAARSVTGIFFVAIIDTIMLGFALLWLIFVCGNGTLPAGAITTLTMLHLVHLIIIVSSCVVFPLDVLYIPFWFIIISLVIAGIDVFILVSRSSAIFGGPAIMINCDFFLWIFDIIFLLFAILYLGFTARSMTWYGSLGDSDNSNDPFISSKPDDDDVDTSASKKKVSIEPQPPLDTTGQSFIKSPPPVISPKISLHKKDDDISDTTLDDHELLLKPTSGHMFGLSSDSSARRRSLKDRLNI